MTTQEMLVWVNRRIKKITEEQNRTSHDPTLFALGGQLTALKQVKYQLKKYPSRNT